MGLWGGTELRFGLGSAGFSRCMPCERSVGGMTGSEQSRELSYMEAGTTEIGWDAAREARRSGLRWWMTTTGRWWDFHEMRRCRLTSKGAIE